MLNQVLKAVNYKVLLSRPSALFEEVRTFRLADRDEIVFASVHAKNEQVLAIEFEDRALGVWYVWSELPYASLIQSKENIVLEEMDDVLEKLHAIAQHEAYDERILMALDVTPEELELITQAAMLRAMTVEDFVIHAINEKIKENDETQALT